MPEYIVRPGMRFGAMKQYGPGDVVRLAAAEAAGFADKLALAPERQPFADGGGSAEEEADPVGVQVAGGAEPDEEPELDLAEPEPDEEPDAKPARRRGRKG
jgi:hypothetical protein